MKLVAMLLSLGVGASIMVLGTVQVAAERIPDGRERIFSVGNCGVKYVHGNGYGGAYAKYDDIYGTCGSNTYVVVRGHKGGGNYTYGDRCGNWLPSTSRCLKGSGWYQSWAPSSTFISGTLKICTSNNHVCATQTYTL